MTSATLADTESTTEEQFQVETRAVGNVVQAAAEQVKSSWGWTVAASVSISAVGIVANTTQTPAAALVLIGTFAGINLLMCGSVHIAYGFVPRRLGQAT